MNKPEDLVGSFQWRLKALALELPDVVWEDFNKYATDVITNLTALQKENDRLREAARQAQAEFARLRSSINTPGENAYQMGYGNCMRLFTKALNPPTEGDV